MFRVEKDYNEYQNKTFRIPSEIIKQLEIVASNNNISVNRLVIQCLLYSLNNLDDDSK